MYWKGEKMNENINLQLDSFVDQHFKSKSLTSSYIYYFNIIMYCIVFTIAINVVHILKLKELMNEENCLLHKIVWKDIW